MEKLIAGAKKIGLKLSLKQLEQFHLYYQELIDWNQRMNLTAITSYDNVQIKHFLDSLTITLAFKPPITTTDLHIIDIGTGAGLPGLPLKILFPEVKMVLLEATTKKTVFLHHLCTRLKLDNVEILTGRAEEIAHLAQYREKFNIVLARGVAPLPVLVELTLPFCAVGGSLIAQKKGATALEISRADKAIELMGGKLLEVRVINLEEFPDKRRLIIIDKVSPTSQQYPRRPGIPAKRPLVNLSE